MSRPERAMRKDKNDRKSRAYGYLVHRDRRDNQAPLTWSIAMKNAVRPSAIIPAEYFAGAAIAKAVRK